MFTVCGGFTAAWPRAVPARTAALIDQLRAGGVVLTYDPQDQTLRADGHDTLSVTIGTDH